MNKLFAKFITVNAYQNADFFYFLDIGCFLCFLHIMNFWHELDFLKRNKGCRLNKSFLDYLKWIVGIVGRTIIDTVFWSMNCFFFCIDFFLPVMWFILRRELYVI